MRANIDDLNDMSIFIYEIQNSPTSNSSGAQTLGVD